MKQAKAAMADLLAQLPGPASAKWPAGERFVAAFAHGTMQLELYAPRGTDPQQPHAQDELYFIMQGTGTIAIDTERHAFAAGDAFFVAAGTAHRFEDFSDDFATWVVFWGAQGGEQCTQQ